MNLIFLDVDGVLNSQKFADKMLKYCNIDPFENDMLDDHAIRLLKVLVDETNARIVLTSSWRNFGDSLSKLAKQLSHHKLFIWSETPRCKDENSCRGDEITLWFRRNVGVFNYVILDDDSDMTVHMEHLVKTSFDEGLTRADVDKAIEILKGKTNDAIPCNNPKESQEIPRNRSHQQACTRIYHTNSSYGVGNQDKQDCDLQD